MNIRKFFKLISGALLCLCLSFSALGCGNVAEEAEIAQTTEPPQEEIQYSEDELSAPVKFELYFGAEAFEELKYRTAEFSCKVVGEELRCSVKGDLTDKPEGWDTTYFSGEFLADSSLLDEIIALISEYEIDSIDPESLDSDENIGNTAQILYLEYFSGDSLSLADYTSPFTSHEFMEEFITLFEQAAEDAGSPYLNNEESPEIETTETATTEA